LVSSIRHFPMLLMLCGLALTVSAAMPPGEQVGDLDEVAVVGKTLRQLQREAIKAEDRFYKRFNSLNTRDDFDIHCRMDKPTGTLVPRRQCRIQFLMDAGAIDAREFLQSLTTISSAEGQVTASGARTVNTPDSQLQPLWLQRREEYRQNAKALLEKDPELMALATEWVRLRKEYDRALK